MEITEQLAALEERFGVTLGVMAWPLGSTEGPATDPNGADGPAAAGGAAGAGAGTTPSVTHRHDEGFPSASTIKLYIMVRLLEVVAAGERGLDDEVVMQASDQVGGSGVLKSLTAGRAWTLRDLAMLMMIVSDNTATNMLIEALGVEAINDFMQRGGWRDTYLLGKLALGVPNPRGTSHTSPRDLADCMARLWRGELLPAAETAVAKDILLQQHYTDTLGCLIGYGGYSDDSELRIASKSGSIVGVRNEVGVILHGEDAYVTAIMTRDGKDPRFWANNPGNLAIMEANRLLFEHFLGEAPAR